MISLLNATRPPMFCPGCSHEHSLRLLDGALQKLGLKGSDVAIISDIGCSGLFDTYFNTHTLHGLHGRALTYAAGVKMASPHLKVIVTMGDGGMGIGGAHVLAACRRNLDLTLLILNNFNFGMTGGQFSCTTPANARVASGFLNTLEKPMDVCSVAAAAGAPYVARTSVFRENIVSTLAKAISFEGFSLVDIWGFCPGRYLKGNPMSAGDMEKLMAELPPFDGPVEANKRLEYGSHYREKCETGTASFDMITRDESVAPPLRTRKEIVLLGAAGERIQSAGSLLAYAAIAAGMHATQKGDYDITVLRGQSVSEVILSPEPVVFTGVEKPDVVIALSPEGVARNRGVFSKTTTATRVILAKGVEIPQTSARVYEIDFKAHGVPKAERALTALALLARMGDPLTTEMLTSALRKTLQGKSLQTSLEALERAALLPVPPILAIPSLKTRLTL